MISVLPELIWQYSYDFFSYTFFAGEHTATIGVYYVFVVLTYADFVE